MPQARTNGIDIAYETFGSIGDRPLILIMGIGSQMVYWPTAFCEKLAAAGHFVVRFDNRDVGLSTKLDAAGTPNIWEIIAAVQAGKPLDVPYRLSDMAADTVGLMDALHMEKAPIYGRHDRPDRGHRASAPCQKPCLHGIDDQRTRPAERKTRGCRGLVKTAARGA
jgi:pimeloyl-ACP methyl ester carboxylesterase